MKTTRIPAAADWLGEPGPTELPPIGRDYLELLKRALLDLLNPTTTRFVAIPGQEHNYAFQVVPENHRWPRHIGWDWPANATTMIGYQRLTNIQQCVATIITDDIPGDLIEAGVWRGGASIFTRACLGNDPRRVWLADSFNGFDANDPDVIGYSTEAESGYFQVPIEEVARNFERYDIPTDHVRFLPGWFKDTIPTLDQQWSLIRLDGDTREQTLICLEHLYPQLSPGGFCIIDDYGAVPACEQAVNEYLEAHDIEITDLQAVDWGCVCWRKI